MLLDTSAWIEFLRGTKQGKKVANVLNSENNFTSIITIAELSNWCLKNNLEKHITNYLDQMKIHTQILEIDETIMLLAGKFNFERKKRIKNWGMIDSIILSSALKYDLNIITKDTQFSDIENVQLLE